MVKVFDCEKLYQRTIKKLPMRFIGSLKWCIFINQEGERVITCTIMVATHAVLWGLCLQDCDTQELKQNFLLLMRLA